jgi:hypothetical protein
MARNNRRGRKMRTIFENGSKVKIVQELPDGTVLEFEAYPTEMNMSFGPSMIEVTSLGATEQEYIQGLAEAEFTFKVTGEVSMLERGSRQNRRRISMAQAVERIQLERTLEF